MSTSLAIISLGALILAIHEIRSRPDHRAARESSLEMKENFHPAGPTASSVQDTHEGTRPEYFTSLLKL